MLVVEEWLGGWDGGGWPGRHARRGRGDVGLTERKRARGRKEGREGGREN